MKTLRLALVGRGKWGEKLFRTLEDFSDIAVSVVAKGDTASDEFDAVLIATPSATHAAVALPYIERGIPVFIEKPMASSLADAKLIKDAAEKSGSMVFVGHIHLFNPAYQKSKELLSSIGRIEAIICESANAMPREDVSVLWDWLPHDLSIARDLLHAEPASVEGKNLFGTPLSRVAVAKYVFDDVSLISYMSAVSQVKRRVVTIVGTKGSITIDEYAEHKLILNEGGTVSHPEYDKTPPLTRELEAFIEAVRTGKNEGPDSADGLATVEAILSAENALK